MKTFVLLITISLAPVLAYADIFDDLAKAIKAADSKAIALYFNKNIDFSTPNETDVYSNNQAEILLKNFFTNYPPRTFTLQHRGASAQGARYVIGKYEHGKGTLRVYILIKEENGKPLIQELHFEKE